MANKTFYIKKGSRISIEINNSEPRRNQAAQNSQGLIRQRREPDYLPRRVKSAGGINFYDLRQIRNFEGVFISNSAALIPNISILTDTIIQTDETETDKQNLIADMESIVFAVDENDWKSKFFKIQKSDLDFEKSISVLLDADSDDPFFGTLNEADE